MEKEYWIWLSLVEGLGAKRKHELLAKYKTPERIYKLTKEELLEINGIGEKVANSILNEKTRNIVGKHIEYMKKNEIDIVSIYDREYPKILKEIYDYPISLYVKGNKEILNNEAIAIIGCREASDYGKKAAKYFAYNLARQNQNIISGLARGIDSFAHIGAVCAKR